MKRLFLAVALAGCGRGDAPAPSQPPPPPDAELEASRPCAGEPAAVLRLRPSHQALPASRALAEAGVPFCVTSSTAAALSARLVILPMDDSGIRDSGPLRAALKRFAESGGTLIVQAHPETAWPELTGLDRVAPGRGRRRLKWRSGSDPALEAFRRPELLETPLASEKTKEGVWTFGLRPAPGTATLADFETGEAAVTRRALGAGAVYSIGLSLRDAHTRPQAERDFEAQRRFSNGFEPGADAWPLFLRGAAEKAGLPRLRAVPGAASLIVLLSHDLGPRASRGAAERWAAREREKGARATWFVQTKTALDATDSPFFDSRLTAVLKKLLEDGHEIGSLGVSHGADFERLPLGGADSKDYRPRVDAKGRTAGGDLFAEASVSRALLRKALGEEAARGFRSPLFAYPEALDAALERAGYDYDSSLAAGAVMSNRPFALLTSRAMTRESAVLEIPVIFENVTPSAKLPDAAAARRIMEEVAAEEGWVAARLRPDDRPESSAFLEALLAGAPKGAVWMTMGGAADFWKARAAARWTLKDGLLELSLPLGAPSLAFELPEPAAGCAARGVKARCEGRLVIVDAPGPVNAASVTVSPARRAPPARSR